MLEEGLVEEVNSASRNVAIQEEMVSMQGLGYKEIFAYLDGECNAGRGNRNYQNGIPGILQNVSSPGLNGNGM